MQQQQIQQTQQIQQAQLINQQKSDILLDLSHNSFADSSGDSLRSRIELLPNFLINQIKAGEVIERPASLIKEIIENSLDAKSNEIKIHIANNGLDFIEIADDGIGILYEDLPLAFSRHTTSKISSFDDLYKLTSFGFRGEALASIAAVSRITMISYPKDSSMGGKIVVEGGEIIDYQQIICTNERECENEYENETFLSNKKKSGTLIYISDLFYNTPARLKFIRSKISEKIAIKKILNAFILSNPKVKFEIKWDNKDKIKYEQVNDYKIDEKNEILLRVKQLWMQERRGKVDLQQNCGTIFHTLDLEYEGYYLNGVIVDEVSSLSQKDNCAFKEQYLFVNRRLISDKNIHQRINYFLEKINKERTQQLPQQQGNKDMRICAHFIFLHVPADHLDVNVHPNKTFVKFLYASMVYSLVSEALKKISFPKTSIIEKISDEKKSDNDIENVNIPRDPILKEHDKDELNNNKKNETSYYYISDHILFLLKHEYDFSISSPSSSSSELIIQSFNILNLHKLILFYFISNLEDKDSLDEKEITPLLVSMPFTITEKKFDEYFKLYELLGFDFDRLSDAVVVLRSIPKFLNQIDYTKILENLIYSLKDLFDLEKDIKNIEVNYCIIKKTISEHWEGNSKKNKKIFDTNTFDINKRYLHKLDRGNVKCINLMIAKIGEKKLIDFEIMISLDRFIGDHYCK
ncbi:MAG: ATP-binding protein [Oligoflexia bacterium]|nr:ATP-binding protein [Oligoflexia bacterium]